jgi:hypothetical protein
MSAHIGREDQQVEIDARRSRHDGNTCRSIAETAPGQAEVKSATIKIRRRAADRQGSKQRPITSVWFL